MIPVLWICGPSGIGKTTVAWELFTRNPGVAYVDIDQLGMCYPPSFTYAGLHTMKARNLAAILPHYAAAGAGGVIVSGVVDVADGIPRDLLPTVRLCRLTVSHAELERRYHARGVRLEMLAQALDDAEVMDRSTFADEIIDTTGLSVAEVCAQITAPQWHNGPSYSELSPVRAGGNVTWLCGPQAVGKSSIGFAVYLKLRSSGLTAFADLEQLGFAGSADHLLRARNVAALWRIFRSYGAERLVMVGPADSQETVDVYARELAGASLTVCRLDADEAALTQRFLARGAGAGPGIPGDTLVGQPAEVLRSGAKAAASEAERLRQAKVGDCSIDTSRLSVADSAALVLGSAV